MNPDKLKKLIDLLPVSDFPYLRTPNWSEEEFKVVINNRIKHCLDKLEHNLPKATTTYSKDLVSFEDGSYFSVPVYKELEKAVKQPIRNWNLLTWQQICRELFEEKNLYPNAPDLFRFASEMMMRVVYNNII